MRYARLTDGIVDRSLARREPVNPGGRAILGAPRVGPEFAFFEDRLLRAG
jgi:hypothetical protein